jgi:hypothetical protein
METPFIYELIGYAASLLVAVSLMMKAVVRLRVVNMAGAFTFLLYGILIGSVPVAAMNAIIVCINIYHLVRIARDREYFQFLEVDENSTYAKAFLDYYQDQIRTIQPAYVFGRERNFSLFVLRNMVPAGLVQGTVDEQGNLKIDLDFVIPRYRDFKVGRYLFRDKLDFFRAKKIRFIRSAAGSKAHNKYLEKTGFKKTGDSGYAYELAVRDQ